ncbi:biopolymer transport protein ExbB [Thermovibrio guaymasensis]|uniref:Biopolymer transport protein ExbB n=1 Tax=Thermovibrio guaymasensis TaxID=240167 RepID=A0A420W9N4_9BACT|nr:MotA/TolQ/ExbB proton channel family protein [Thermovibrio guaymasensis]RKQ63982.1 biopolymer transport protein ExbB [Thermovibrio guaymasensis]
MVGVEILQKAGVVGYVILFLSVISVAIIIEKFLVLRLSKLLPKEDLRLIVEFLSQGNIPDAVELCKKRRSFLTEVIYEAIKNMGIPTRENFLSSFEVSAKRKLSELERGLTLLATIAAVSPLLGLLGTVIGMVKIFGVLNAGGGAIGNPQELSAGVAQALLTTIFGLVVAIPAIVMYNIFQRKLDKIATELESAGILIANNFKGLKK